MDQHLQEAEPTLIKEIFPQKKKIIKNVTKFQISNRSTGIDVIISLNNQVIINPKIKHQFFYPILCGSVASIKL